MSLSFTEASAVFGAMLDGEMAAPDIKDLLISMADRGETAEEIAGAVTAMRKRMISITAPDGAIDLCGTGGDGQHSLNVSTACAIVVAACGVPMAKHGNRAASSKAGAADTLEALGLNLAHASARAEQCLTEIGIAFLFAQNHHPALAHVMPIRREIGRRTIFNLIGPLANPARVTRQLIGVATPDLVHRYRDAARMLGIEKALIVSGQEGLDEISIAGPSAIAAIGLSGDMGELTPEDAGLPRHPLSALRGGDAAYNADALRRLLMGEHGAYRDAVLLNSAAALMVAGKAETLREGAEDAAEILDKGLAKTLLDCWIAACL